MNECRIVFGFIEGDSLLQQELWMFEGVFPLVFYILLPASVSDVSDIGVIFYAASLSFLD